ncbi:hypothetical protein KQ3_04915 [Bacillus cereus B5-2]|nr:hypothetical protein KQ3_04915 [Bacillus cereus B5-2]
MTHLGMDTNKDCSKITQNILDAGFEFVIRYYGDATSKRLSKDEAKTLSDKRIGLIPVFENYNNAPQYFSHDIGFDHGTKAFNYAHNTIEQPTGTVIFFAVDYDASNEDTKGIISEYFQGVAEAFSQCSAASGTESTPPVSYNIGVYGSGAVCEYITTNVTAVTKTWHAMSTMWRSASSPFFTFDITQSSGGTLAGIQYDSDASDADLFWYTN